MSYARDPRTWSAASAAFAMRPISTISFATCSSSFISSGNCEKRWFPRGVFQHCEKRRFPRGIFHRKYNFVPCYFSSLAYSVSSGCSDLIAQCNVAAVSKRKKKRGQHFSLIRLRTSYTYTHARNKKLKSNGLVERKRTRGGDTAERYQKTNDIDGVAG